jgi:hypothetical protein
MAEILVSVNDANNLVPITNATFSSNWWNDGGGNYRVELAPNQAFWCDSPNHRVQHANSDSYSRMLISLVKDTWP